MKPITILGVLLIVLGIAALAIQSINYTTEETVLNVGPITATAEKKESIPLPPLVGIAALVAGGFLVFIGRRR